MMALFSWKPNLSPHTPREPTNPKANDLRVSAIHAEISVTCSYPYFKYILRKLPMMTKTLTNNFLVIESVCSSRARTFGSFSFVFLSLRSGSSTLWMPRKSVKHTRMYLHRHANCTVNFGVNVSTL